MTKRKIALSQKEIRELPEMIGVKEVALIFGIGRDTAYALVKKSDFPKLPIEKPLRFSKAAVLEYGKIKLGGE